MARTTIALFMLLMILQDPLRADCDRTFADAMTYGLPAAAQALAAFDADGDGRLDLFAGTPDGSSVLLARGDLFQLEKRAAPEAWMLAVIGDTLVGIGTNALTTLRAGGDVIVTPLRTPLLRRATAGDFDADGHPDVAAAGTYGSNASISIFAGDAHGTFSARPAIPTPLRYPFDLFAADMDGDGTQDLVAAKANAWYLLRGNGDGSFAAPAQIASFAEDLRPVAVADFDGDGRADIRRFDGMTAPHVADLDGDGNLDVIAGTGELLRGRGDGTFERRWMFPVTPLAIATGDGDGDGDADVAFTTSRADVLIFHQTAALAFDGNRAFATSHAIDDFATGDLDNDGRDDVVTAGDDLEVFLSDGASLTLHARSTIGEPERRAFVALGDFTGDGVLDALMPHAVRVGQGNGDLRPRIPFLGTLGFVIDVAAGDVDGDGDLDAVGAPELTLLRNDGHGTMRVVPIDAGVPLQHVALADVDSDGIADLLGIAFDGGVHLAQGRRVGGFAPAVRIAADVLDLAARDADGDGTIDLIVRTTRDVLVLLPGNGNGTFRTPVVLGRYGDALAWHPDAAAADVDGDGADDRVTAERSGSIQVHRSVCRDALRPRPPRIALAYRNATVTASSAAQDDPSIRVAGGGTIAFFASMDADGPWYPAGSVAVSGGTASIPAGDARYVFAVHSGGGELARSVSDVLEIPRPVRIRAVRR